MRVFMVLLVLSLSLQSIAGEDDNSRKIDSLTKLISSQSGRERVETLIELSALYRETSLDKSRETDSEAGAYASSKD